MQMFPDSIKSVLLFWYHDDYVWIVFRGRSRSIVEPGVFMLLLSLINFLRPLSYTRMIVVLSISNVSFNTLTSSTDVLHLSECSVVGLSSSSMRVNLPSHPLGFSPLRGLGSGRFGLLGYSLFVFELFNSSVC